MNFIQTLLFLFIIHSAFAQTNQNPTPPASQDALQETQKYLKDSTQRQQKINEDPRAKEVDQKIKALAGSDEAAQEIYGLSSDIMGLLMQETGGDPVKMQKLLEEASKNPAAFAKRFSPEQQKKLKEISKKTPAAKGLSNSPH